jgi:hypothetical protein
MVKRNRVKQQNSVGVTIQTDESRFWSLVPLLPSHPTHSFHLNFESLRL